MCLVLAFTNTKKIKLSECLNNIGNTLLASETDGFGYAIQGRDGVFGEKTIARRFRTRLSRQNHIMLPIVKTKYMSFGTPTELAGPGIFHGRSSTNIVNLKNTHPMQAEGWHLIHNGVVDDHGPAYDRKTDNDSEDVLRRLIDGTSKTNLMTDVERYLEGYYAFAAIDPQGRLHICRDGIAPLHIAYSQEYDTFIIGTTESLILKVNKILGAKIGPVDEIQDETYCIFNGNDLIHCQDFKARGFTSRQAQHSTQSLGITLPMSTVGPAARDLATGPGESLNDNIIDVSEEGWQAKNKDKWHDSIMDYIAETSEQHPDRGGRISEENYYRYKNEIDNMDASYTIYSAEDKYLSLQEFKKLDYVSQESCTILRADGTVVDPEDYETPRLRGRHGAE